jgi:hypothetical protein
MVSRLPWREIELELAGQKFLVGGEFGVTAEDQGAAVSGREMDVEHLDRCKLVEHSSRREARRQRLEPCTQRDVQAVGQVELAPTHGAFLADARMALRQHVELLILRQELRREWAHGMGPRMCNKSPWGRGRENRRPSTSPQGKGDGL